MFRTTRLKTVLAAFAVSAMLCLAHGVAPVRAGDCVPYQYAGSEMWGQAVDMVLENDTLFVLMTHGLLLIDVSNPDAMIRLGQYPILGGRPILMQRSKGIFYIVAPTPHHGPETIYTYRLSAAGGLQVIDQVEPPLHPIALYVSGDSLYAMQENRLTIFSTTQPESIQQVYQQPFTNFFPTAMVKRDSVFVFAAYDLQIRDARPGSFMNLMSTLKPMNTQNFFPPYYRNVKQCGPYLVAIEQLINISFSTGWVQLIDISDPFVPKRYGNHLIPRWIFDLGWGGEQIHVASDYGVTSFTVSDDTLLQFKSWFQDPGGAGGIEMKDHHGFTFTRDTLYTEFTPPNCRHCWCDTTGRDSVYLGDILTLDFSADTPCVIANYRLPGIAAQAALRGDFLYTAETSRRNEINLYDVSLTDTIVELEPIRFHHPVNNFAIAGDILWAGSNQRALYVYGIDGPRSFTFLDSVATAVTFKGFSAVDTVLHYLTFNGGYQYRNATLSGSQLIPLSTLPLSEILTSIAVADTFVAIGRNDKALLLSTEDLENPRVVCTLGSPPVARGVVMKDNRLVLFGSGIGLSTTFYNLFPTTCPAPVAALPEFNGHTVVHLGKDIYASGPRGDMQIWSDFSHIGFTLCDSITPNGAITSFTSNGDELFSFQTAGIVRYRRSPSTDVGYDEEQILPDALALSVILAPNPTNAQFRAHIVSTEDRAQNVNITVFDVLGRTVAEDVVSVREQAQWTWPNKKGGTAVSGVYFIRFQTESEAIVRKAVML